MCRKALNAKWLAENPERAKAIVMKWQTENPERVKANVARWLAENPERKRATDARWLAENPERKRATDARWQAASRQTALELLGTCCAWSDLGGCAGDLEVDHIIPPGLRRNLGYTSSGAGLVQWIRANPELAQVRLQLLCNEHNRFKSDTPNHEARAEWSIKHPITWRLFE